MARKAAKTSPYKPHPYLGKEWAMKKKLEAASGRSWDAWIALAKKTKIADRKALRDRLMKDHEIGSMAASWVAYEATAEDAADYGDPEPMVDALYAGERKALRPVHDALVDEFNALGDDVIVTACKTMVPVYRKHVFAELRPSGDAVEVCFALGEAKKSPRLVAPATRMPGDRMTHAVRVRDASEVDAEFRGWMATAYAHGTGTMARKPKKAPPAFAKAIAASKPASATWASMTPAMQRDMVEWVEAAKQEATRERRLATVLSKLSEGKKRVY